MTAEFGATQRAVASVAALSMARVAPSVTEVEPLPLVEVAALPEASSMRYGMARVDQSGRMTERTIVDALGWTRGQHLRIEVVAQVIVLSADPCGESLVCRKASVTLPTRVRRRCDVQAGDSVLLTAAVEHGVLAVHPTASLEAMVAQYHATLTDQVPS